MREWSSMFIPHCTLVPIPSLWRHPAGAGASPADKKFLNEHIGAFMVGRGRRGLDASVRPERGPPIPSLK